MKVKSKSSTCTRRVWRKSGRRCATLAALAAGLFCCAGCDDELWREFRTAATSKIETGVNAVADGIITGLFTIAEPSSSSSSSDSSSSSGS